MRTSTLLLALAPLVVAPPAARTPDRAARVAGRTDAATAAIDTAIARMGGARALRAVERMQLEMMTQWQRTSFDARPYVDVLSYERHSDLRDYTVPAWRNTRHFPNGAEWREIVDVVRGDVAIRRSAGGQGGPAAPGVVAAGTWVPLNVAYVDERRELFAFAPERVLLLASEAPDRRAMSDTSIAGVAHARVAATIDGFPSVLFLRRTDGFLAAARYRAAHPNDLGLVPWGEMEVELWYSQWRRLEPGIAYPMQWDVRRVGRPYKRMTVLSAIVNPQLPADAFDVADSLRTAYLQKSTRAMHDVPFDSARLDGPTATFGAFGAPAGAVKLGGKWLLLESGQAPLSAERATRWLEEHDGGASVAGALITLPAPGNGGAAWLAARRTPLYVGPGVRPFVETVLRNHGRTGAVLTPVTSGRWLRVGGDSLWLEPIDLPNAPGALLAYVPSLRLVYSAMLAAPLELEFALARLRARGWVVERVGSLRGPALPAPSGGR